LAVTNPRKSSEWAMVQIIGGFFNGGATKNSKNFFIIDEVKMDNQHIGPPPGFMPNPSPAHLK